MKRFRLTVDVKPFLVNWQGKGEIDLNTITDEDAEILLKRGSTLVEPLPAATPKTRQK